MSTDLPSFDKAEYALTPAFGSSTPDHCTLCQQPIAGSYYRVSGNLTCNSCATQATSSGPADSHAAFTRAILCGIAAAIVGMILYAVFEIATGIVIGYLAIGVGFLVGKAMKYGSNGRGGRRYQVAAALLTYASVSMAAVPVAIYSYATHKPAQTRSASPSDNRHPFPGDPAVPAQETRQPPSPAAALLALVCRHPAGRHQLSQL